MVRGMIEYLKGAWDIAVADFVLKSIIALSLLTIYAVGYGLWVFWRRRK